MKNYLAIMAFCLTCFLPQAFAQRTDKNSLGTIVLSNYPRIKMPLTYTTYSLVDEKNQLMDSRNPIVRNFYITGPRFSRSTVQDGADIVFKISGVTEQYGKIDVSKNVGLKFHHGVKPDLDFTGKGTKLVGYFVDVYTEAGLIYSDSVFTTKKYESPSVRDPKVARFLVDSMYAVDDDPKNEHAFNLGSVTSSNMSSLRATLGMGYMDSYRFHVYSVKVKSKCKYNYDDLIKAAETFEKAAKVIEKNDMDIDAFKDKAAGCFATWQNALAKSGDPRMNKDIQAATYYNLGTYYVFVKNFDKAIECYNKAMAVFEDFADSEKLVKNLKEWNKAKTRYEQMMAN